MREGGLRPPCVDPGPVPPACDAARGIRNPLHVPGRRYAQRSHEPQGEDGLRCRTLGVADCRLLPGARVRHPGQKESLMIPRHSLPFGVGKVLSAWVSRQPPPDSSDLEKRWGQGALVQDQPACPGLHIKKKVLIPVPFHLEMGLKKVYPEGRCHVTSLLEDDLK